jgi:probable HAF family extracellular repeat protein
MPSVYRKGYQNKVKASDSVSAGGGFFINYLEREGSAMLTKKGNKVNTLALVFISLMLFGISLPSSAWAGYTYTDIIPPDWQEAWARSINDGGAIVGYGYDANNVAKGFLYSEGNYTDIIPPDWQWADAWAINDGGAIVGQGTDANGVGKVFLYSGGNYTDIIPPGWQTPIYAWAINDGGAIVGVGEDANSVRKGFLYSEGNYTDIIPPNWQWAYASDINDGGAIVGGGDDANGVGKVFLYSGGNYTDIIPPDWMYAFATAINDGGAIVGGGDDANYVWKGFLYSGGNYTEIIPPAWQRAEATAINDGGAIVGWGQDANYVWKGFIAIIADSDGDGVPDDVDQCPASNLAPSITIGTCDSGVTNTINAGRMGCTRNDMIAKCADSAKNHGQFVECVSHLTNDWETQGQISGKEKGAIKSCTQK